MKDYYYILGIKASATDEEIKDAYRMLSKKFHPDLNQGNKFFEEMFKEIQEAHEVLSNPYKRGQYDFAKDNIVNQQTTSSKNNNNQYNYSQKQATPNTNQNYSQSVPHSEEQYYKQQYAQHQQKVQQDSPTNTVYDLHKVRMLGLQKLGILVALALVGYFILPKFMASISSSTNVRKIPKWGFSDNAMSAYIIPLIYCGWTIATYIGRKFFGKAVIFASIGFWIIRFVIKLFIAFYLGFYCLPFFLIIFISFAVYPDIVNKFKPMRFFIN